MAIYRLDYVIHRDVYPHYILANVAPFKAHLKLRADGCSQSHLLKHLRLKALQFEPRAQHPETLSSIHETSPAERPRT